MWQKDYLSGVMTNVTLFSIFPVPATLYDFNGDLFRLVIGLKLQLHADVSYNCINPMKEILVNLFPYLDNTSDRATCSNCMVKRF